MAIFAEKLPEVITSFDKILELHRKGCVMRDVGGLNLDGTDYLIILADGREPLEECLGKETFEALWKNFLWKVDREPAPTIRDDLHSSLRLLVPKEQLFQGCYGWEDVQKELERREKEAVPLAVRVSDSSTPLPQEIQLALV